MEGENIISITPMFVPLHLEINCFGRRNDKADIEVLALVKYYFVV